MRRFLAIGATLGLVLTGAAVSSAAEKQSPAISWGACEQPTLKGRAECGFLSVPLDHAQPQGKKIKLALSRVKHTVAADKYQGVMLVNPGGPGGSGLGMSALGSYVPDKAGAAYDWIGFDPRGVGDSEPALACDSKYQRYGRPQYVPGTKAVEQEWLKRSRKYAAACARAGGELLDHLKTTDTVQDIDLLRAALGAEKINFYGYSYGTYLGQVYATRYPQRVRRMVLDGVVNPARVWYDANLDQDIAFDANMKRYFGWLAKHDKTYRLGSSAEAVEKLFYAEQAKLNREPAAKVFSGNELTDVFLQAGYYVFGWETVATAFSTYVHKKDVQPLRDLFEEATPDTEGSDNGYAVYLATQCTDVRWPSSWHKWRADNWQTHAVAPFETWGNAWFNAPCLSWAAKPGRPANVDGRSAPPILLINETFDAATPFSGALETRKRFPRAALVEGVGGTTHSGSLFGGACVDKTVAAYLATGALPHRVKANMSDKKCTPVPQPAGTTAKGSPEKGTLRDELRKLIH